MSCRVATFAEIHSTKDIDICRKFNDIYVRGKSDATVAISEVFHATGGL